MRRTLAVSLVPAAVLVAAWLRLESPVDQPYRAAAVALLALLPALVRPLVWRLPAIVVTAVPALAIAFDVSLRHPRHLLTTVGSRFGNGFLDFYDVKTPFDPRVHTDMRGVVIAAVFGFVVALGWLVSSRKPLGALLVLLVGAGWPATLRGSAGALTLGVVLLAAGLVLLAGLTSVYVPRVVVPAAAAVALVALAASTSSAVAKGGVVPWQGWDFYTAPAKPVSVSFVWDANYTGIRFPRTRTTVLEVKAPDRSLFWRADVLDEFNADRWQETDPLRGDASEPSVGVPLVRQDVKVLALSDTHLVGASAPVRFDAGDAPIQESVPGTATLPSGLTRGFRYTAWSFAPEPQASSLRQAKPDYPVELVETGTFLDVWHRIAAPPFGVAHREQRIRALLHDHPFLEQYAPLARQAFAVAGNASTPYGAAAALETWFRTSGGFAYTNRPPLTGGPALVDFVTKTRAGYCQHFAGAMALMLRYLGVPARVAVGFSSGTYDSRKGIWRVTDHDAHAWVEVWFRGFGWLPFDPTPSGRPERGDLTAPYELAARTAGSSAGGGATPNVRPGRPTGKTGEPGAGIPVFTPVAGHGGSRHNSLVLLLLAIAAVAGGAIVALKTAVRRVRYVTRDPRRIAAACRRDLADYLVDQRVDAARSATLHELGALVDHELGVDARSFVAAATAARFGPPAGAGPAARRARRELRGLRQRIRERLSTRNRVRGLLSLRSFGFEP